MLFLFRDSELGAHNEKIKRINDELCTYFVTEHQKKLYDLVADRIDSNLSENNKLKFYSLKNI